MRFCSMLIFLCAPAAFTQAVDPPPTPLNVVFPAGTATELGQQVATIAAEPGVVRAHWGIAVTAMDGTPIYGLNEGEYFRPASNAKLFTTAAAMHLLGPDTKISTVATLKTPIKANG